MSVPASPDAALSGSAATTDSGAFSCVRCGTFDLVGPAAAIGLHLCGECFRRPPEPLVSAGHRRLGAYLLAFPAGVVAVLALAAPLLGRGVARGPRDDLVAVIAELGVGGCLLGLAAFLALLIWNAFRGVVVVIPLEIRPESLAHAADADGIATAATLVDEGEGRTGIPEGGILCATPRGIVIVGLAVRLALGPQALLVWQRDGAFEREALVVGVRGQARRVTCIPAGRGERRRHVIARALAVLGRPDRPGRAPEATPPPASP